MDVLAVSDFPDLRRKAVVHSASHGSVLIIPREGGYMVRMYIELDKLAPSERVAHRNLTPEHLVAAAQRILHPYTLSVKEVAWWSVYEIGQRLCDSFDNAAAPGMGAHPRAFIVGDACHTHSPKAGQGMNVSMADSFNLGWKLGAVLQGRALPDILASYSDERRAVAQGTHRLRSRVRAHVQHPGRGRPPANTRRRPIRRCSRPTSSSMGASPPARRCTTHRR
jgi:phenol 2-monooxygenase